MDSNISNDTKSKKYSSTKLLIGIICIPQLIIIGFLLLMLPMPLIIIGGDDIYNSPGYSDAGYYYDDITITVTGDYDWPLPGYKKISSAFGSRIHPLDKIRKVHTGIDIPAPAGASIIAVSDGVVEFSGIKGSYGNLVIIKHSSTQKTYYAHNQANLVRKGDVVVKGQTIAKVGSTGASTGPHLHFETRVNNSPVDPLRYYSVKTNVPNILPEDLKYREVDREKVRMWLENRNSYLANETYVNQFINTAKQFDLDVFLLIAITGQEQSFVPKNHIKAEQIAKNPFNVFGSWQNYGVSFAKSAEIAARTVVNLSKNRPEGENPIRWLSSKSNPRGYYAEDNKWWIGVSKFYEQLRKEVGHEL